MESFTQRRFSSVVNKFRKPVIIEVTVNDRDVTLQRWKMRVKTINYRKVDELRNFLTPQYIKTNMQPKLTLYSSYMQPTYIIILTCLKKLRLFTALITSSHFSSSVQVLHRESVTDELLKIMSCVHVCCCSATLEINEPPCLAAPHDTSKYWLNVKGKNSSRPCSSIARNVK